MNQLSLDDNRINSIDLYNARMTKSISDKTFFLDSSILPEDVLVFFDFGCADASLYETLKNHYKNKKITYLGYDQNSAMIQKAVQRVSGCNDGNAHWFSTDFNELITHMRKSTPEAKSVLVLSSVLHEVHTYCTNEQIKQFWTNVWSSGFDYVIVRDMSCNRETALKQSKFEDELAIHKNFTLDILYQWQEKWGQFFSQKSLLHFLLTYHYMDNWDREFEENYFALSTEELINKVPDTYKVTYFEHYTLDFIRNKIRNELGITINDKTHVKMVIKKV